MLNEMRYWHYLRVWDARTWETSLRHDTMFCEGV